MKYTNVIAMLALLGATEARSLSGKQLSQLQSNVSVSSESESSSSDSDNMHIQTGKILETVQGWTGVEAKMHKFPGTKNELGHWVNDYERTLPERFDDEALDSYPVDKFTQNLIANYAVEGLDGIKVKNPTPNGRYFMKKETLRQVAKEVLGTHFGKTGKDAEDYLNDKFDYSFDYYDVNKEGRIDAIGMSAQFMRFLCKPLGDLDI